MSKYHNLVVSHDYLDEGDISRYLTNSDESLDDLLGEERVVDEDDSEGVHGDDEGIYDKGKNDGVDEDVVICDYDEKYNSDELLSLVDSDEDRENCEEFNPNIEFSKQIELKVGLKFPSINVLRKALVSHAIENGYDFYYTHNQGNRVSIYCKLRCSCPWKKGKRRHDKDCTLKCSFNVHARKMVGEETIQIKSLNLIHNCGKQDNNSKVTAEYLALKYLENWRADPNWNIRAFEAQVVRDLGVQVGYYKCWFAKVQALKMIYGDSDDEYKRVWDYAETIKEYNPGSSSVVKVDSISRPIPVFQRIYVCLDACKKGFIAGCRPIIGVDGCHLKGKYPGQCIVAVGEDGNNNIYPLAWAVVEVENKDTWVWFLELVLGDIGIKDDQLTIMSDRQKGLLEAFNLVCPNAHIRFCVRHILANFKLRFSGSAYKESLWAAARSTTKEEFNKNMEGLKFLSEDAHKYLNDIPSQHWSKHAMSPGCKSDMLTNNICESFNNVLRSARDKPVLSLMEWIRRYVMKRHFAKRERMKGYSGKVMPYAIRKIEFNEKACRYCTLARSSIDEFEVGLFNETCIVNLRERKCTCYLWQLSGIPCTHAIKCIKERREFVEDYVDKFYSFEAYMAAFEFPIHAMPGVNMWKKTGLPEPQPPLHRVMPGRPSKKKRTKEPGEEGEEREIKLIKRLGHKKQCKKCGIVGHNVRTCKNETHAPQEPVQVNVGGRTRKEGSSLNQPKRKYKKKSSEECSGNIQVDNSSQPSMPQF